MAQEHLIIEQWMTPPEGGSEQWLPILILDSRPALTKALAALKERGAAGLFRVLPRQQCVWAEKEKAKLRLHGAPAATADGPAEIVKTDEREGGHRPGAKARETRARAKAGQVKK